MNKFLSELGSHLEQVMVFPRLDAAAETWGNAEAMTQALARVQSYFDGPYVNSVKDVRSVADSVLRFRKSRELSDWREIKYVCIGASQEFSGWRLLEDAELLAQLLRRAGSGSDRQRLRHFTCLLCSYWSFPRDEVEASAASGIGWVRLREWLARQRVYFDQAIKPKPEWLSALTEHANLLTDQPCKRYARDQLENGSPDLSAALSEVLQTLGVASDCWLRQEAIYAQVQACAEMPDTKFQYHLGRMVELAGGKTSFTLSRSVSIRCLALLVSRYAVCPNTPEHIPLRDACIAFIGNPWLHRAAWDGYVLDKDRRPDANAREMVNGWLKVRLIKDFFGLLSEDRSADSRRLNYWLGFEPMIQDMWFALGADALSDSRKEYGEFRQRANGRLLDLAGSTPTSNNAFLMHFGEYLVIEFGITGNACFVYHYDRLPPRIKAALTNASSSAGVDIADLKARGREARLLHNGSWEPNFDAAICPLLGYRPSAQAPRQRRPMSWNNGSAQGGRAGGYVEYRPEAKYMPTFSHLEFERFRSQYSLNIDDLRSRGGCLWVRTDAADSRVTERLQSWGFIYRPTMGWWKE
jgi:hypothetical protein